MEHINRSWMFLKDKLSYSSLSIVFVFVSISIISFKFNLWKTDRNIIDSPSYYTYLPAAFIYHDLHLTFIEKDPQKFRDKIWYLQTEDGKKLIKHPMGLSLTLSPFFLLAKIFAPEGADGYSYLFQNFITLGVWCYLFLGLFYLRKFLLSYFTDKIVAVTLLLVVLATNLLWYSTFEVLMPHAVSFSIWCIALYAYSKWLTSAQNKYLYLFSAMLGLSILIRPLSLVFILFFFLWGYFQNNKIEFFTFLKTNLRSLIVAALLSISIASLQLMYWKYATGKFLFDVYMDEHFLFNDPEMIAFLFSFRKGLFVYTPLMFFALLGFYYLYRHLKQFLWPVSLLFLTSVYILSSWWAWSYGICWGMRPMIDYYAVLSIPLAGIFTFLLSRKSVLRYITISLLFLIMCLNLFQTWQYKKGLIHYDDMSREAYFKGFMQTQPSNEWFDLLKPYNWNRRVKGMDQICYSRQLFDSLSVGTPVYFRTSNLYYASCNAQADHMFAAFTSNVGADEVFYILKSTNNTIAVRASTGKYLSLKEMSHNMIVADADNIGDTEKFTVEFENESDNKIWIKASNGKYVKLDNRLPLLLAQSDNKADATFFRFFLLEDYNKNISK